jgi:hypothetical protein
MTIIVNYVVLIIVYCAVLIIVYTTVFKIQADYGLWEARKKVNLSRVSVINKKIDFKTSKINRLKEAIQKYEANRGEREPSVAKSKLSFFQQPISPHVSELYTKLKRQEDKVAALTLCLP